jgi:hypothetical protein
MSTVFGRLFARAGAEQMMRSFSEDATYHPAGATPGRVIEATVERGTLQVITEIGEQVAPAIIVRVRNSSTLGISSTEIDTGTDEIALPLRDGAAAVRRRIVRVISDANGLLRLLVQ